MEGSIKKNCAYRRCNNEIIGFTAEFCCDGCRALEITARDKDLLTIKTENNEQQ